MKQMNKKFSDHDSVGTWSIPAINTNNKLVLLLLLLLLLFPEVWSTGKISPFKFKNKVTFSWEKRQLA